MRSKESTAMSAVKSASGFVGTIFAKTATGVLFLLLACSLFFAPLPAWAEGGVQCSDCLYFQAPQEGDLVSPDPGPAYYLFVEFDKNVSYANNNADDAFVQDNLGKVHLRKESGEDIDFARIGGAHDQGDRRLIYVYLEDWLAPLTTYQVVVDPGIRAANGEDVSTEEYVFTFKTSALCSNGLTVFQMVSIAIVVVVFAVGVVVAPVRVSRRRR